MRKTLKLITQSYEMLIPHIKEYVCGYDFLYVRLTDGQTLSFDRSTLRDVLRQSPSGRFQSIHLKKRPRKASRPTR